uniref:Uncharacterized protein n=1 Tax=Solanum lycopersicum TaxID=4081 RepID=A0A3Q7JFA3_SOLLC
MVVVVIYNSIPVQVLVMVEVEICNGKQVVVETYTRMSGLGEVVTCKHILEMEGVVTYKHKSVLEVEEIYNSMEQV